MLVQQPWLQIGTQLLGAERAVSQPVTSPTSAEPAKTPYFQRSRALVTYLIKREVSSSNLPRPTGGSRIKMAVFL